MSLTRSELEQVLHALDTASITIDTFAPEWVGSRLRTPRHILTFAEVRTETIAAHVRIMQREIDALKQEREKLLANMGSIIEIARRIQL